MTKKKHVLKVIKIGNSIGVILPKKDFDCKDLEPYVDWVKVTIEPVRR